MMGISSMANLIVFFFFFWKTTKLVITGAMQGISLEKLFQIVQSENTKI